MKNSNTLWAWFSTHEFLRTLILVLSAIIAYGAVIYPVSFMKPWPFELNVGDVAPQGIQAPENMSYVSEILTEQSQQNAVESVNPIYLPTDPNIARQQIERLRATNAYISTVRSDEFANEEQKLSDIAALSDIRLSQETSQAILSLEENHWQSVQQESLRVLEQSMRSAIREDRVADAKRNITSLISFSIPEDQAKIVDEMVQGFIVPNNLYSEDLTSAARLEAQQSVKEVNITYIEGETIINKGQIITPVIRESLQVFELIRPQNQPQTYFAAFLLILISAFLVYIFFTRYRFDQVFDLVELLVISILFLVFLAGARLTIPENEIIGYLYPIPAFGMILSFLYKRELAFTLSPILSVLAAYGLGSYSTELTLFYLVTSIFGILFLGRGRRIASFFRAGLAAGVSGFLTVLIYTLPNGNVAWLNMIAIGTAAIGNGILSASLTLLLQSILAQAFGLTTPLRLLDISRPDHPLMQLMLQQSPGTYQHSLQVANLAVQAAESIGENALLTRVGSLYHDAGKALNPSFFIENQVAGQINPHDSLEPIESSKIIINHVLDGIKLAKKYRLPPRIQDFMLEHHGTMVTNYQYTMAVKAAGNDKSLVDPDLFRYPGPSPLSKETAILMLADGVEARARAMLPQSENELRKLVQKTIEFLQQERQLDQTDLTLNDLHLVTESFVKTLNNTHHLRIKYPKLKDVNLEDTIDGIDENEIVEQKR